VGNAQEWGYAPIQLVTQDDANKKDKVDTFHIVDMLQQMHHGEHYIGSGFSIQDAITNLWSEGGDSVSAKNQLYKLDWNGVTSIEVATVKAGHDYFQSVQ
jgi:hypothetical protein